MWNGIPAYDACPQPTQRAEFTLHGLLLWTMHDWPGNHPYTPKAFIPASISGHQKVQVWHPCQHLWLPKLHAFRWFHVGAHFCSGLTTSGLHGCPMCHDDIHSLYNRGLSRCIYGRHRRFLPVGDPMRQDTDHWFQTTEDGEAPAWPDGDAWLTRWEEVQNGIVPRDKSGMRRLAIWWQLPYWKVSFFPMTTSFGCFNALFGPYFLDYCWFCV